MNPMKQITILLSLLVISVANAQSNYDPVYDGEYGKQIAKLPKEIILEEPLMEYIYYYLVSDPEINKSEDEYKILLVGRDYTLYKEYNRYRLDSLLQHRDISKVTNKEYRDLFWKYVPSPPHILKNKTEGLIWVYDRISPDTYYYEENTPDFHWKLEDGTRTVCGHTCQKATCSFRGREWTAWYAVDIPMSQGPWKFGGLPGLIMQVEDSKREHVFTAVSIRKGSKDCMISRKESEWYFKTNREWFLKTQRKMMEDPLGYMQSAGVLVKNPDGTIPKLPKKRLYAFNPIEKE